MFGDGDVAVVTAETAEEFVVVPGDIDDAGAFAGFAEEFLDDVVMGLRPVNSAPHLPDIDQVADDVESFEFVGSKEFEKSGGVAGAGAEMNVGDPCGTKVTDLGHSNDAETAITRRRIKGLHLGEK